MLAATLQSVVHFFRLIKTHSYAYLCAHCVCRCVMSAMTMARACQPIWPRFFLDRNLSSAIYAGNVLLVGHWWSLPPIQTMRTNAEQWTFLFHQLGAPQTQFGLLCTGARNLIEWWFVIIANVDWSCATGKKVFLWGPKLGQKLLQACKRERKTFNAFRDLKCFVPSRKTIVAWSRPTQRSEEF